MPLTIYDTLRRSQVPFEPREHGRASIYVCGPTVQAGPHVGHGRASVVFDVLRRWLIWNGTEVTYVSNVTDVDDKIIVRAARESSTPAMIAETYTRLYNATHQALGVLPPDVQPRATGHLLEMQQLMTELLEQDKAYVTGGNVLFRVRRFEGYGKLSNRRVDEMQQGEDLVAVDKEDPLDFALWKAAKEGEPAWASPWGPGRPGWHIECSAMASAHLGGGFDIHGGGLDLIFPHHENEIAQYEAARGGTFARYWMHNGMVQMGDAKMSKSIGNIVALDEAVARWGKGPLRLWYLSAHHRSPLVYEADRLEEAANAFERLTTFVRTAGLVLVDGRVSEQAAGPAVEAPGPDEAAVRPFADAFAEALDDDLNAPKAVAALHEMATAGYDLLDAAERGEPAARAGLSAIRDGLVQRADRVLGLGVAATVAAAQELGRRLSPLVERLVEQRREAREQRDFATADRIRDDLAAIGVTIEDRPGGTRWYVTPEATTTDTPAAPHAP